jgi:hypothetical protein
VPDPIGITSTIVFAELFDISESVVLDYNGDSKIYRREKSEYQEFEQQFSKYFNHLNLKSSTFFPYIGVNAPQR